METLVKIENNQAVTNSLLIAEKFGKNHRDVLQTIRYLLTTAENSAVLQMFSESIYLNKQNKEQPMFIMNRDAFSLLAMGFTGEKALKFKLDFIEAFNKMEEYLKSEDYILMRSRQILDNKVAQLEYKTELQEKELEKQAPKVEYYDKVLQVESTYNTNLIAKELGMSAITLNKILAREGVQYKQQGTWVLKSYHQNKGYTKTKTVLFKDSLGNEKSQMQTVWTEKGRAFIHNVINKLKQTA